jgi:hypothetical protein
VPILLTAVRDDAMKKKQKNQRLGGKSSSVSASQEFLSLGDGTQHLIRKDIIEIRTALFMHLSST